MTTNVDLIIPGLFDLPVDESDSSLLNLHLPAFNQILRFGRLLDNRAFDLETMLIESAGWTGLETLPFAQAYAKLMVNNSDRIILFKAIYLRADMYNAVVVPLEDNSNNAHDIDIIINDLGEYFNVDCDIKKIKNGLWLMQLKQTTPAQHYLHYLSAIGKKFDPFQQSNQVLPWYQLMNEMQMFMHQHKINHGRLELGLPPINSLWFWGAGNLLPKGKKDVYWHCDDQLLTDFARSSDISCANLNSIKAMNFSNDSIIIDLALLEALKVPGENSLQNILCNMEARLFEPLIQGIKSGKCKLRLWTGSGNDLILSRYSTYKYWKKPRSLLTFAGTS